MGIISKFRWTNIGVLLYWLKKVLGNRIVVLENFSKAGLPAQIKNINRVDYILNYCAGKTVLHFGFTDYPYTEEKIRQANLLHLQLKTSTKKLWGFDYEHASIQKYITLTGDKNVFEGDILNMDSLSVIDKNFEIILLGEILEHLKNPHQAIENLYNCFPVSTLFLVTVPNYTSLMNIAGSLHNVEMIHPDHYWHFSPLTLLKLFPPDKFELIEFNFGMYFMENKKINVVLKKFAFLGECIIAVFKKK